MKVSHIRVENYKGFRDSGRIELDPHWNVIIGRNNAGKSALIETFRFSALSYKPHLGLHLSRGQSPPPQSRVSYGLSVKGAELKRILLGQRSDAFFALPLDERPRAQEFVEARLQDDVNTIFDRFTVASTNGRSDFSGERPSHGLPGVYDGDLAAVLVPSPDQQSYSVRSQTSGADNAGDFVLNRSPEHIYVFYAKRFGSGSCGVQDTATLSPDASNLAAVMAKMNVNPSKIAEFNTHIRTIFPSIQAVTAAPGGDGLEVRVWPIDPKTQREDLTLPLDECGTGVGQVLSILYVAMNSPPGTIVIDEPGSFLHPGAAKAMLNILRQYDHHQYVISTHSPELLGVVPEARVFSISTIEGVSSVSMIDRTDLAAKRAILEEVGVAPSDIFAADQIIWVEGPTERDCFYRIYESKFGHRPTNFTIVPLRATGDFERRAADAEAVLDLYVTLSLGGSLLPPTVGFSFDRERKSDQDVEDFKRRLKGLASILPRAMIENYFLNAEAIQYLLDLRGLPSRTVDQINATLIKSLEEPKMVPANIIKDLEDPDCLVKVDGARVLNFVFDSCDNYSYRKVQDGPELLSYMMEKFPEKVSELVEFAWNLMNRAE